MVVDKVIWGSLCLPYGAALDAGRVWEGFGCAEGSVGKELDVKTSKWHIAGIGCSVMFSGLSAVHLIDDFLADVPREFNLSVDLTLLLSLAYMVALVGLIAAAAARRRTGYLGLAIAGLLITLAQMLKSIPEMMLPGPWRAGPSSEWIAVGLVVSAFATMITSFLAWRSVTLER